MIYILLLIERITCFPYSSHYRMRPTITTDIDPSKNFSIGIIIVIFDNGIHSAKFYSRIYYDINYLFR